MKSWWVADSANDAGCLRCRRQEEMEVRYLDSFCKRKARTAKTRRNYPLDNLTTADYFTNTLKLPRPRLCLEVNIKSIPIPPRQDECTLHWRHAAPTSKPPTAAPILHTRKSDLATSSTQIYNSTTQPHNHTQTPICTNTAEERRSN